MAPYLRVARQEAPANGSDSTSEGTSAVDGAQSFMDAHSKEIYIGLAVVAALIVGYFAWAGTTYRLSYPPFNQKRCIDCKKGISKNKKEDEDYFKNEDGEGKTKGKGGWVCKECQEKREKDLLDKELNEKKSSTSNDKSKSTSASKGDKRKPRVVSKKVESDSDEDEHDDYEEDDDEERDIGRQNRSTTKRNERDTVQNDNRKSRAPPPSRNKKYESEQEIEYDLDSDEYLSTDEEDEKPRKKVGRK